MNTPTLFVHTALLCRDVNVVDRDYHFLGVMDSGNWSKAEVKANVSKKFKAYFILRMRSGNPERKLWVELVGFDQARRRVYDFTLNFQDNASAVSHEATFTVSPLPEGLFWLELFCDEGLLTAIPLRVFYTCNP